MFYAHTKENTTCDQWQRLNEHLQNVASLAENMAVMPLKQSAKLVGLLHDIGKYQPSFVKKLVENKNIAVDHAICGAKAVELFYSQKPLSNLLGSIIAGHHSGLPNIGNAIADSDQTSLKNRLKKHTENFDSYQQEIGDLIDTVAVKDELLQLFAIPQEQWKSRYEFVIRYLYSCLVDADFLDTEQFCLGKGRQHLIADWQLAYQQLCDKLNSFKHITTLQQARVALKDQALSNIYKPSNTYLLDMPTGSGKTLCSLQLALELLKKGNKKRIIYVIPYTSIIEQTAKVFADIMPELNILQHHSGFDFDEVLYENLGQQSEVYQEDIDANKILKQNTENWDCPFVITTNVQFFESIYSNRSSKLRKLHNMADSVIVFDEIHTLPIKYFIPCMQAVAQLTAHYNSQAIFLTATMPDYTALCSKYLTTPINMLDLLPDKKLYSSFEKCTFCYLDIAGCDILSQIDSSKHTLVVCNTKKLAEQLYSTYNGKKYHLSTYMTPNDRTKVINEIRQALADSDNSADKIVVFSTSLIEAGVDLDFECVYREMAGVENILQTAGRCNREGKRSKEDSLVYIFDTDKLTHNQLGIKANITKGIIDSYGAQALIKADIVKQYYDRLYKTQEYTMQGVDDDDDICIEFKTIAEKFKLIDSSTVGVVVPCEENAELVEQLKNGVCAKSKLNKYSATVSVYQLKELLTEGVVQEINGVFVLIQPDYYDSATGIKVNYTNDYIY